MTVSHIFVGYDANPTICRTCGAVRPMPCFDDPPPPKPTITDAERAAARERMLIAEALDRLDPDTLNDDLEERGEPLTSGAELDQLARTFKADQ